MSSGHYDPVPIIGVSDLTDSPSASPKLSNTDIPPRPIAAQIASEDSIGSLHVPLGLVVWARGRYT